MADAGVLQAYGIYQGFGDRPFVLSPPQLGGAGLVAVGRTNRYTLRNWMVLSPFLFLAAMAVEMVMSDTRILTMSFGISG